MASEQFPVIKGPTKFELMIAVFEGGPAKKGGGKEARPITFRGEGGDDAPRFSATIEGHRREDDSYESWYLSGEVTQTSEMQDGKNVAIRANLLRPRKAEFHLATNTRKGYVKFLD